MLLFTGVFIVRMGAAVKSKLVVVPGLGSRVLAFGAELQRGAHLWEHRGATLFATDGARSYVRLRALEDVEWPRLPMSKSDLFRCYHLRAYQRRKTKL